MENKDSYQADLFTNRLKKKYRELRKWARKSGAGCYRVYDRDIPEIPLSLDVYEFLPEELHGSDERKAFVAEQNARVAANDPLIEKELESRRYAVLYLYERPYEKPEDEETAWLSLMAISASYALSIPVSHVIKKMRRQQKGLSQYEKSAEGAALCGIVHEQDLFFSVNLTSYLDTGLFFDHRPLRALLRENAGGKRVLNLFCYTGSFSVYAAAGGASYVESVDLSNTYLGMARNNMAQNGFSDAKKYVFTKADAIKWLLQRSENVSSAPRFDIIVLDPPTFSNSKSSENILDINRDWPLLVEQCVSLLNPNGILYFSTNSSRLSFDEKRLPKNTQCRDITAATVPRDFEGTKCHRCWKIVLY